MAESWADVDGVSTLGGWMELVWAMGTGLVQVAGHPNCLDCVTVCGGGMCTMVITSTLDPREHSSS